MAEKKKKKPTQVRGMPTTSVKSRMPSKAAKGQAGKKSIMPGLTGAVKAAKARREKKKSSDKWVLGEKLTKAGRERARRRKKARTTDRKGKKAVKGGLSPASLSKMTKEDLARKKKIGAKKSTAVRKGAKKVVKTKGGEYVKYGKKTEAAKSFRSTFKSKCAGDAKTFTWDGRKYSCAKK